MTLQIGRLTGLPEPMDWKNTGDQVQFRGRLAAGSANAARVLRDQLLAYNANVDEPVIPIVSAADDNLSGFCRITSVEVPTTPAMLLANGTIEYAVHGQQIGSFKSAVIESLITGALRVNSSGVAAGTGEPFHAYPAATAYEYTINVPYTIESRYSSPANPSPIWVRMNPSYKALARWAAQPAKFYDCAVVLTKPTPVTHIVVGQQDTPHPYNWTIGNTLVSITPGATGFDVTWADTSGSFRTVASIDFIGTTLGTLFPSTQLNATKIIRNAPEEVILRVPCTSNKLDPTYIDVAVRRGSHIVRFYITTTYAAGDTWTWGNHVGVASTALTGGQVWTANDGFGNRALLASAAAFTNTLATGRIAVTGTVKTFDAGVSFERLGTGSAGGDTAQNQIYQYFAAQAERMQVIGR